MTEDYAGRQVVGMDLHRHRSVLVRMTEDGRKLGTVRIVNSPAALRAELARAGENPRVVLEATYGWYWAADTLAAAGAEVHLAHRWPRHVPLPAQTPMRSLTAAALPGCAEQPFGTAPAATATEQATDHNGGYRTLHVGRAVTVGNEAARCPGWEVRCPAGQSRLLPPGPCWRPAVKSTHPLCREARPGHRWPRIARQLKRSARQIRRSPANSSAQSHGGTASGTSSANYRPNSASYRSRSH